MLVPFPYVYVFSGLFAAYLGFSVWTRLDPRYPVAAAMALFVFAIVEDAGGNTNTSEALGVYVFILLVGGVALLLVDHVRPSGRARGAPQAKAPGADPSDGAKPAVEQRLDRLQQQPVTIVEAAAQQHDQHEQ